MNYIKNTLLFILISFSTVLGSSCNSNLIENNKTENVIDVQNSLQEMDIVEFTKTELETRGWECISTTEGLLDYVSWSSLWGNAIIGPDEEEKDKVLYTMVGRHTDESDCKLYAIVKILATKQKESGEVYRVIYISESGRIMDLENDNILSPKDSMLQDYMYSY